MTIAGMRKVRDLLSIILAMAKDKHMENITARITSDWNSKTGKYDILVELRIPGE